MQRWGQTAAKVIRYRCVHCAKSSTWKRPDNHPQWFPVFLKYLISKTPLEEVARLHKVSSRTLMRAFEPYWMVAPLPLPQVKSDVIILDGTSLNGRTDTALIARSVVNVKSWKFVYRENEASWTLLLNSISDDALVVVCDGQKGLIKAIYTRWKDVKIQRCIKHVKQGVLIKLSTHPKTLAGQDLYQISKDLTKVWTRRQKRRWIRRFIKWQKKYSSYLSQRSTGILPSGRKHSWFTHKRLRGASSLISGALPDLFRYVGHYHIPRTTNHLEGGINARIKELIHSHRGLPLWKKQIFVAYFLRTKQGRKPTRFVT